MPLRLLWRNLLSHPVRLLLTVGSLVVALFLLCTLRSVVVALTAGVEAASASRLVVQSAVSLFVSLPLNYQAKIEQVPGVDSTCKLQWFGGYYQDPSNYFAQFAVDTDRFFLTYPEIEVVEGSREEWLQRRAGCLIGVNLVRRFGWRVGDTVPLVGTIFPRLDGSVWNYEVVGVYRSYSSSWDDNTLFFPFEYLDESVRTGACGGPRGVGVYMVNLEPGADPVAVMKGIDDIFENGPQRVQTTTEAEFARQFVTMLGNVPTLLGSIGGGVLFAMLLAVVNTMLMAGRERTRDIGILKALGFTDASVFGLLLGESLLLSLVGTGTGIGLALLTEPGMQEMIGSMFPGYQISGETIALGLALGAGIGLVAGVVPAWRAGRMRCVDALRAEV